MVGVSEGERRFVADGVQQGVREDGRGVLDLRHLVVENGVIEFCNGSALIERVFTASKVLVGVKVEMRNLEELDEDADPNLIDVSVDCTTLEAKADDLSQKRLWDLSQDLTMEVENQLKQMIGGKQAFLEIIPGKFAWRLLVDIVVLGTDGNLSDLVGLAVYSALVDTRIPQVKVIDSEDGKDFEVDPDPACAQTLPPVLLRSIPIRVSLYCISGYMIADASDMEEMCSSCTFTVLVNRRAQICGTQITKPGRLKLSTLPTTLRHCSQIAAELFKLLDNELSI